MKSFMRIVAFFSLGMLTMLVMVSLHAKQATQQAVHPTMEIVQPTVMTRYQLHSEDHTADVLAIDSLWANYTFYNDTHNGPGMASLFTEDAITHFVWNNHGKLVPTFGINGYQTPDGMNGGGCRLIGRKDVAGYFGYNRAANFGPENLNGLAIPGPSHHVSTNQMVKVDDDGKTAMLTAYWMTTSVATGAAKVGGSGLYRVFLRKTPDGWQIAEFYGIADQPTATTQCDMNGPLPRPQN